MAFRRVAGCSAAAPGSPQPVFGTGCADQSQQAAVRCCGERDRCVSVCSAKFIGSSAATRPKLRGLQGFMETENQKAVIQAAISKLTETCFDKCVTKPSTKLDSSEANCIANCAGRYLDSSVFVVNRMMAKRQQQSGMQ